MLVVISSLANCLAVSKRIQLKRGSRGRCKCNSCFALWDTTICCLVSVVIALAVAVVILLPHKVLLLDCQKVLALWPTRSSLCCTRKYHHHHQHGSFSFTNNNNNNLIPNICSYNSTFIHHLCLMCVCVFKCVSKLFIYIFTLWDLMFCDSLERRTSFHFVGIGK